MNNGAKCDTSTPEPLFKTSLIGQPEKSQYDVRGDGRRFVFGEPTESTDSIVVVLNWIIKNKVGLLKLSEMLGSVSEACKVMGYSRDSFYRLTGSLGS